MTSIVSNFGWQAGDAGRSKTRAAKLHPKTHPRDRNTSVSSSFFYFAAKTGITQRSLYRVHKQTYVHQSERKRRPLLTSEGDRGRFAAWSAACFLFLTPRGTSTTVSLLFFASSLTCNTTNFSGSDSISYCNYH